MKSVTDVVRLIEAGMKEHNKVLTAAEQTKVHALEAGWYFLQAKNLCEHGGWTDSLAKLGIEEKAGGRRKSKTTPVSVLKPITVRSVQRYMQFTMAALKWAEEKLGEGKKPETYLKEARTLVLESPREFTELLRSIGVMKSFGEYDEIAYRQRQIKGPQQIEFSFAYEKFEPLIVALQKDSKVESLKDSTLRKLRTELEASQKRIDKILADRAANNESIDV